MSPANADRVRWVVETLTIASNDRVLEVGCGSALAAVLICERLVEGRMLAIDRSATQIERARRRNAAHVAGGRLRLETVPLADLNTGADRFTKVFAVNVNVFWQAASTVELERVRRALAQQGRLYLFYEAPGPAQARSISERIPAALRTGGFAKPDIVSPTSTRVCFISAPS